MPLLSTFQNLDKNIVAGLSRLSNPVLTAESLIEKDHVHISRELMIPIDQLDAFRLSLLRELSPPLLYHHDIPSTPSPTCHRSSFNSAFEMRSVFRSVSTSIACCSQNLNGLLGGGIQMNEITELVGLSGVGKTQFCFTVAADAALAGHTCVYIDTTNGFSGSRMSEILKHRMTHDATQSPNQSAMIHQAALSRIHVVSMFNIFDTMSFLDELVDSLCRTSNNGIEEEEEESSPSLLVLDSITSLIAPIMGSEGKTYSSTGQSLLAHLMKSLDRIASFHCIGVLITNDARREVITHNSTPSAETSFIKPALGHSWQFLVKTRLLMRQCTIDSMKVSAAEFNDHSDEDDALSDLASVNHMSKCSVTVLKHSRIPSAPNMSAIFSTNPEFSTTVSIGSRGVE